MAAKGQGTADMGAPENQQRLQMGMFPEGCEIVPNPYNRIPGFFIKDHAFVPGFPVMAWPMLEWTLDTRYRALQHIRRHFAEHSFLVFSMPESRITPAMQTVETRWPGVRAFSLPSVGEAGGTPHIDLGEGAIPGQRPRRWRSCGRKCCAWRASWRRRPCDRRATPRRNASAGRQPNSCQTAS